MAILRILGSSSKGNCYLLETKKEVLILDCGVAPTNIIKALPKDKEVVGCLVTHSHKDHVKAIDKLLNKGVRVYTSEGVKSELQGNCEAINTPKDLGSHFEPIKINNFLIIPYKNNHTHNDGSECPCVGYLIHHPEVGSVLFATDTYKFNHTFRGVNHFLIECNYAESIIAKKEDAQERVIRSHMSLENLTQYLNKWDLTKTKDITLLHLSERNGDKDLFRQEVEAATAKVVNIAEKGVVLEWD